MIQRAVNTKTKAGLKFSIMVIYTDSCYSRGHCLSQNTSAKVQTQGLTAKESKPKESRYKETKPADGKFFALFRFDEVVKPNC